MRGRECNFVVGKRLGEYIFIPLWPAAIPPVSGGNGRKGLFYLLIY